MEKQNLKLNFLYNKINMNANKPFKDIKFTNNQNNLFLNKDKDFHNKYLLKIKEKNNFQNRTLYDKTFITNKFNDNIFLKEKKFMNLINDIDKEKKENKNKTNKIQ